MGLEPGYQAGEVERASLTRDLSAAPEDDESGAAHDPELLRDRLLFFKRIYYRSKS